ncbi:MAG TPA: hypothetical protein VFT22_06900 [Kofleriaceae bacterium]|nr:hypothetical protein [Kofleriaceae bacterium]
MNDPRADALRSGHAVPTGWARSRRSPGWMIVALLGAAGCREAAAEPGPPAFTGERPVDVLVTAAYGRIYPPRKLPATLQVAMHGKGVQRTVTISARQGARRQACALQGRLEHGALIFRARQPCELELSMPDVCVLPRERCDARVTALRCDREQPHQPHPGRLVGQLVHGQASEAPDGKWTLALEYSVDACVLAQGFNRDAPILVQGGTLTVETR